MKKEKYYILENKDSIKNPYIIPVKVEKGKEIEVNDELKIIIPLDAKEIELIPIYQTPIFKPMTDLGEIIFLQNDDPENPLFAIAGYSTWDSPQLLVQNVSIHSIKPLIAVDQHYGFICAYNLYRKSHDQKPIDLIYTVQFDDQTLALPGSYSCFGEFKCENKWFDLFDKKLEPHYVQLCYERCIFMDKTPRSYFAVYKGFGRNQFILTERTRYDVISKVSACTNIQQLEWAINHCFHADIVGDAKKVIYNLKDVETIFEDMRNPRHKKLNVNITTNLVVAYRLFIAKCSVPEKSLDEETVFNDNSLFELLKKVREIADELFIKFDDIQFCGEYDEEELMKLAESIWKLDKVKR